MRQLPPSAEESTLIALLLARSPRGFSMLYRQYGPALYGIALRIVRSPTRAEDVLQEAMVKVWRKIDGYDPAKGTLFTWLLNVVRNTAISQLRADKTRSPCLYIGLEEYISAGGSQVSCQVLTDHIGLDRVLVSLSLEQQRLIEYLYFRGYTQAEAAQALDIPLGTVKTRLRLALCQLRERLREDAARLVPAQEALKLP